MKLDLVNSFLAWRMKKRYSQIELFMRYPHEVQHETLLDNLYRAKDTEWGERYGFGEMRGSEQLKERVPIQNYEALEKDIDRMRAGAPNILWPGEIKWFSKSSGTTSSKSKFIPVSPESLENCHFKGGKDLLSIYCNLFPDTSIFGGLNLRLGGSLYPNPKNKSFYGDVSAIIIENLPIWVEMRSTPNNRISLMQEWEKKIEAIANTVTKEDVRSLAGVPSWMLVLMHRILEKTGKENLHQVWPNLELYMHGGVSFAPYRTHYEKIMGKPINYLETYNASEGFFGIQDQADDASMLLMLDYGIYYEFIPMDQFAGLDSPVVGLDEVKLGENYAMVITTNGGLWRYLIGDTIRFTCLDPFRFVVSGRTKHFINAFGEEVIIENAEKALAEACRQSGAVVREFTVAPRFMDGNQSGAHQWLIEFDVAPESLNGFREALDQKLKEVNSDYEAKRHKDMALKAPEIEIAPKGLFYKWLEGKNKLGGQHKVPRLSNDRKFMEELLALRK